MTMQFGLKTRYYCRYNVIIIFNVIKKGDNTVMWGCIWQAMIKQLGIKVGHKVPLLHMLIIYFAILVTFVHTNMGNK